VAARDVFIVGTRSFAAEVAEFARDAGLHVLGLLEPYDRARVGQTIHDLSVSWLEEAPAGTSAAAIVGTGESRRRELTERLRSAGWQIGTLIHPRAHIAASTTIGSGSVIGPGVVVGARAAIGEHVVLGRGALVGHHTSIGAFSTLGPGANVAGNVRVEPDALIAMGALVRDHRTIGASAVVAMGAVVVGDVPAGIEVRGVPARAARRPAAES
jgi:sugar O-acyltransferase (sialic acid O-acetyltransferase NeuD family)